MADAPIRHANRQAAGTDTEGSELDESMVQVITRAGIWTVDDDLSNGFYPGYRIIDNTTPGSEIIYECVDNTTGAAVYINISATGAAALPQGHKSGLVWSNGTDATNDIDISAGKGRSSDDTADFEASAAFGKQLDVTWAPGGTPGTPTGGLSSSLSIANTSYHICAIVVGGTDEIGFDTSPVGANLIADHTATFIKRLGSIHRVGGAIVLYKVTETAGGGLDLDRDVRIENVSAGSATRATGTLSLPTGVVFKAKVMGWSNDSTTTYSLLTSLDQADTAPSITAMDFISLANGQTGLVSKEVKTNTSAQIGYRSNRVAANFSLQTEGFIDARVD